MSGEGLPLGSIGPAEASSAATRVQQLQELVAKSATATTAAGESSFAAALQAASAEGGGPPEAPEPPQAPEVGPGETGGTSLATAAYAPSSAAAATAAYSPTSSYSPAAYASTSAYSAAAPTSMYSPSSAYGSPTDSSLQPYASTQYGAADATSPLSPTAGDSGASAYAGMVEQAATQNGVEPALLMGLIEQESGFDPNAQSGAGAMGLTQLMPSTAASLGVTEPLNPEQSISGGARLLGQLLRQFGGNTSDALAAYNAGAGAVEQYGGIPPYPETEAYVSKVLANAQSYRGVS